MQAFFMKRPLVFLAALGVSLACSFNVLGQTATDTSAAAPSGPPSSTAPSDQNYRPKLAYQVYYADYLALKRGKAVDLIFIGDSITEQWRWGTGIDVWQKHFEDPAL